MKRRRRLLTFLVTLAVCYAGLCVLGRFGYRALLYPAPRQDLTADPPNAEKLSLVAADGMKVNALLIASGPVTIVFFHGNGEVIGDDLWLAEQMSARGFSSVLVEYRGYGRSAGSPSEAGLYADAEAVLAELARRGTGPENVVLWGQSLGTGVAAEMARRGHGAKLVLISPYTSIPDVGAKVIPWLPVRLLVEDRFATREKAPSLTLPSLIVHGTADQVVPFAMGEELSRVLPDCTFVPMSGGRHEDLFLRGGAGLLDRLATFAHPAAR